jgi:hypothetical protein
METVLSRNEGKVTQIASVNCGEIWLRIHELHRENLQNVWPEICQRQSSKHSSYSGIRQAFNLRPFAPIGSFHRLENIKKL